MTEITAWLKDAYWCNDHRAPNLSGKIYCDRYKRFESGVRIYTSTVLKYLGDNTFQTRNSVYRVENWKDNKGKPCEPVEGYTDDE